MFWWCMRRMYRALDSILGVLLCGGAMGSW